ncbi:MAG: sensor domain-containing diguanylate cyclase [Lachnospiraceae bacterium]
MNKQNRNCLVTLLITQGIICLAVLSVIVLLSEKIYDNNKKMLQRVAISDTEEFMKEKVDNTIIQIDRERKNARIQVTDWIHFASIKITDEESIDEVLQCSRGNEYGKTVQVLLLKPEGRLLWNGKTGKRYINKTQEKLLKKNACVWNSLWKKEVQMILFVENKDIDGVVKEKIRSQIHAGIDTENEYIWINEIINWDGGDHYAIRYVHPNLIHTEGEYLSTKTQDGRGNSPYEKELEGIKEKGELFQTYSFKNKLDDRQSEKFTYAKLYEPYQWIIATGKPWKDIFHYTGQLEQYHGKSIQKARMFGLLGTAVIFGIGVLVLIKIQYSHCKQVENYIRIKTELDPLTGALTKKSAFHFFEKIQEEFLIMSINLDYFKKITEDYGQGVGDRILKKVAQELMSVTNKEDKLVRWKEEGFLLIGSSNTHKPLNQFAEELLSKVNQLEFCIGEVTFHVSVSMGIAYKKPDEEFANTIKRAEQAMDKASKTGKNRYCLEEIL